MVGDVIGRVGRSASRIFILRSLGMGLLLLMHTVLARRLGPGGYGIVSYGLSIASFAALVTTLGLHNGVTRFAAQYLEGKRWGELKGVLVRSFQIVLACSVIGSLVIAVLVTVSRLAPSMEQSCLFASVVLPFSAVGLWRIHTSRALGGVTAAFVPEEIVLPSLVVITVLVWSVTRPAPTVGVYLGAAAITTALGLIWLMRQIPLPARLARSESHTRLWLSVSLPMTVASVTQLSLSRGDALLVGALTGMEETGRYLAVSRIAILVTFALRIVDVSVAPMMSAAFHGRRHKDLRAIFRLGLTLSVLGGLPFFVAGLLAPRFVLLVFGGDYLQADDILRVLFLGQMANAATGPVGFLLLMTGHERLYAKAIGAAALLSIAAHVMVIPEWGGLGAAWVTTVSIAALNFGLLGFGIRRVLWQDSSEKIR